MEEREAKLLCFVLLLIQLVRFKEILAMNTTEPVVEIRPQRFNMLGPNKPSIYMKYDFRISTIIIHHLDDLFGPNILTSSQLAFTPCEVIQDSIRFWIPRWGFRIPGARFRIPSQITF